MYMNCLKEKIITSSVLNNDQYILSPIETFNIIPPPSNITYENGAPICINNINVKYDCLGLTLPLSFTLCGQSETFDIDCGATCSCINVTNSIPSNFQDEIDATIASANSTIQTAQTVPGARSITEKTTNAYNAYVGASNTTVEASNTIQAFITALPVQSPAALDTALRDISDAVSNLTNAESTSVVAANGDTSQNLAVQGLLNTSLGEIQSAIAALSTLTLPSSAQRLLTIASSNFSFAQTAVNNITAASPWSVISTAILNVYLIARYIQQAIYITAQSIGNNSVAELSNSLGYILFAVYAAVYAGDNYNSSLSETGSAQINSLDDSATFSIASANYSIDSVNYSNNQTKTLLPLYRNFRTCISNLSCCNMKCCSNECCDKYNSILFYQQIRSFHICNLSIYVSGCIGYDCFTAELIYPNLTSIETLGFEPIILNEILCMPKGISSFNLKEKFIPDYKVQCIYPNTRFNSDNPLTFTADIYSHLNLKTILETSITEI